MGSIISDWMNKRRAKTGAAPNAKVRIEPMTGLHVQGQSLESPYVAGRREWNERYGDYIARTRTWQIAFFVSTAFSGVLVFALVDLSKKSSVQPYVVEVNKLGEAVAARPADIARPADERIIRFQVANFITNARSITPDRVVQKRWLDGVYAVSSASAATFLNEHYRKSDPFEKGRNNLVSVEINTAMPLSETSWQVQWTETTRGLNGLVEGTTRWQAILNLTVFTPTTAQQIIANPTGIVIDQITWTQQL